MSAGAGLTAAGIGASTAAAAGAMPESPGWDTAAGIAMRAGAGTSDSAAPGPRVATFVVLVATEPECGPRDPATSS